MLCSSATLFMTGVWFAEHLFSHIASVFLSLHESSLPCAVITPSCNYSLTAVVHEVTFTEFV